MRAFLILLWYVLCVKRVSIYFIFRLLEELMRNNRQHKKFRRRRMVMCGEMIPRILHKEMREKRRIMARSCHRTAVLSLNVVDFTYLCADASPEQITIILSKLLDMIEHRLENYQNLFKVY